MKQKIIKNTEKYLTPKIILQCFFKSKVTNVDKQVCGNGFSTAFLNLPIAEGDVNIIIAPFKPKVNQILVQKESP